MAMRVCNEPGCPELVDGASRCADHRRAARVRYEAVKGDRHQQGYGWAHRLERRRWIPKVAKGDIDCARCGERISPLEPWHLDHTDDRTGYLGPSHVRCNVSAPHLRMGGGSLGGL